MSSVIRYIALIVVFAAAHAAAAERVGRTELGDLRLDVDREAPRTVDSPSALTAVSEAIHGAVSEHLTAAGEDSLRLDPMIQAFIDRSKDPAVAALPMKISPAIIGDVRHAYLQIAQKSPAPTVRDSVLRLRDLQDTLHRLFEKPENVRNASLTELEAIARTFGEPLEKSVAELKAAQALSETALKAATGSAGKRRLTEADLKSTGMPTEIERRWLVTGDEWRKIAEPGVPYIQGYLAYRGQNNVRVRIEGEAGVLTVKGKSVGKKVPEINIPIPIEQARHLLMLTDRPPVEKVRYKVPYDGKVFEIDEFVGLNAGLLLAELEQERVDEHVVLPPWIGFELTEEPGYSNVSLYIDPYTTWSHSDLSTPDEREKIAKTLKGAEPTPSGKTVDLSEHVKSVLGSIDPAELHAFALARWNEQFKRDYLMDVLKKLGQGKFKYLPDDYHDQLKEMRRSASRLVGVFEIFDARHRGPSGSFGSFVSQFGNLNDALDDDKLDEAKPLAASLARWLEGVSFDAELKDFKPAERSDAFERMNRYAERIRSSYKRSPIPSGEYHSARQDFKNFMFFFRVLSEYLHTDRAMEAAHKMAFKISGALGRLRDEMRRAGKEYAPVHLPDDLRQALFHFLDAFQGKRP